MLNEPEFLEDFLEKLLSHLEQGSPYFGMPAIVDRDARVHNCCLKSYTILDKSGNSYLLSYT